MVHEAPAIQTTGDLCLDLATTVRTITDFSKISIIQLIILWDNKSILFGASHF
jgi:hypothetical protein